MIQKNVRQSVYYKMANDYDFTEIIPLMAGSQQADINAVVLHNMLNPNTKMSDVNTHPKTADMLTGMGFDTVLLGFNETMDQGLEGLQNTIGALQDRGLTVVGASSTEMAASTPVIRTGGGVKVAFMHYTSGISNTGKKKIKSDDCAWALPVISKEKVTADVALARLQGADVVVVSIDWGKDSAGKVTSTQRKTAEYVAEAGADIIIGTASGVVKTTEMLQGSHGPVLCCYNLGCLISDSRNDKNVGGMILNLSLSVAPDGSISFDRVACTPTYVWRDKVDGTYDYRIVVSNAAVPDGMDNEQVKAMKKAYGTVRSALGNGPVSLPELN